MFVGGTHGDASRTVLAAIGEMLLYSDFISSNRLLQ